jgi:CubicO group peptidase (beta-lactamase class C family)
MNHAIRRAALLACREITTVFVAAFLLAFAGPVWSDEDARFERLAAAVDETMKRSGVPGVALGIFDNGRIVTRGFGVTSIENPLPVTDETLFQAGSISKTFTGTLILHLVEAGKLRLEAPVREYIPTFRVKDEAASREATVLTLLTHMGGWEGDFFDDTGAGDDALAEVVNRMAGLEQISPINAFWSYNNAGFLVAGRLAELATGKSYEQALKELMFEPLGLKRTFIVPTDVMTQRFAVGHGGPPQRLMVFGPWALPRCIRPAGGIITTIKDLLRYGQFHLGEDSAPGTTRPLSKASIERMQRTQLTKQGTSDEMAIAWQISNEGGVRQVWHDGSTVGQQSLLLLVPSKRFAVALLTNSFAGEQLNRDIARLALKEYLGVTITDPQLLSPQPTELAEYVGKYSRPFADVNVTAAGGRLMIQMALKQGFPTPDSPVPPPPPAIPYAFYAKDRLIVTAGPLKGARAEFLRRQDGTIGWIRLRDRVARKQS